jgi:hypothetical protein
MPGSSRVPNLVARFGWLLAAAAVVVAAAAVFAWAFWTLPFRPPEPVEAEALFDAARLRAHLPLYVDPLVGAREYGLPPSRYYVLYPPVWAWLVSLLPAASATILARLIGSAAWLGLFVAIVATAPKAHRRATAWGALAVTGLYTLVIFGCSARPDALAVAFAGIALLRAVRRETLGVLEGALFALGAWTKPNVFGIAAGVLLGFLVLRPRAAWRPALGGAAVSLGVAGLLTALTGRAWIDHLLRATGQPVAWVLWKEQLTLRLPFFALPIAYVVWCAWPRRGELAVRLSLAGLASTTAWTLLSLAKIGSASVYWMEPSVAGVTLLSIVGARLPQTSLALPHVAFATLAAVQSFWTSVASIRSVAEGFARERAHADLLAGARAACGVPPDAFVAADQPGPEFVLNGRIMTTPFQMTHLARRGKFPLELWQGDLASVRCVVVDGPVLDRPPEDLDPVYDRLPIPIRTTLASQFHEVRRAGEWRVYARGR